MPRSVPALYLLVTVGVYMSMYFCNVWPRKTWAPIMLGSIIEGVGIGVLAWAIWSRHLASVFGMMALTGAGTGLRFMPGRATQTNFQDLYLHQPTGSLHAIGFFPNNIATIVSLMAVALPFGGTLALTVMSTVFNNTSGIGTTSPLHDLDTLKQLPAAVMAEVVNNARVSSRVDESIPIIRS